MSLDNEPDHKCPAGGGVEVTAKWCRAARHRAFCFSNCPRAGGSLPDVSEYQKKKADKKK